MTPQTSWPALAGVCLLLVLIVPVAAGADATQSDGTAGPALPEQDVVYLAWQRDPATTMTVQWLSEERRPAEGMPRCRPVGAADDAWQGVPNISTHAMPGTPLFIHHAEFTGLSPDTPHHLQLREEGQTHRFRTMPAELDRPIRFVLGADVYSYDEMFRDMNKHVAPHDPDFMLINGDIAYANGDLANAQRWIDFLHSYEQTMRGKHGRLVPMVLTIGNHEVNDGGFQRSREHAPFFYSLFAFPAPNGYGSLSFGDYMAIVLLDSDHTNRIAGAQTRWLAHTLEKLQQHKHLFVAYHVPVYPASRSRSLEGGRIRKHWVPLFDLFRVDAVFEAHDHAYKRSQPMRGGEVDPMGTVYIGDGSYTKKPREAAKTGSGGWFSDRRPYLARAEGTMNATLITINGDTRTYEALDPDGLVFDAMRDVEGNPKPITITYVWPVLGRVETIGGMVIGLGVFGVLLWFWRR